MTSPLLPPLPAALAGIVRTDPDVRRSHAGSRGPVWIPPLGVAVPRGVDEVAAVVEWCRDEGVAVTPRGAGTGMPGGNVGPELVMDLTALDSVTPLDDGAVRAGAGAVAARVDAEARRRGRYLPALPSSAPWCTVGGMLSADAAGARSFRFGPTHRWTRETVAVRASGAVDTLRRDHAPVTAAPWGPLRSVLASRPLPPAPRVRKNASGYAVDAFVDGGDPIRLLAGSEGTLAVFTEVVLDTEPLPARTVVVLVGLPELEALPALAWTADATGATACEYLGRRLLELGGLLADPRLEGTRTEGGLLLVEYSGDADSVETGVAAWARPGLPHGGLRVARDGAEIDGLWGLRHAASPAIAEAAGRRRSIQFIEDAVVPVEVLPRYVREVTGALEAAGLDGVVFGHAGDGNLHVNPLVDLQDPAWPGAVRAVLTRVADAVAGLGGTLSGEHGDGRIRAPLLGRIWDPEHLAAFRTVKHTLDPWGILNPGVVLPLPGQDPLEGLALGPDLQRGFATAAGVGA